MIKLIFWLVLIGGLEIIVNVFNIPEYLFPKPSVIGMSLLDNYSYLLKHSWYFLFEFGSGLLLSIIISYMLSICIVTSKVLNELFMSVIMVFQTIPKIVLAPFILLWLGFGFGPKIFFAVFLGVLPILINTVKGLTTIDDSIEDVIKTYNISKLNYLLKIQIPNSIPYFFTGIKTSIPFIISGVIVGEWLIGNEGLGYVVFSETASFNIPLAMASLVCISIICLIVYMYASKLESKMVYNENSICKRDIKDICESTPKCYLSNFLRYRLW